MAIIFSIGALLSHFPFFHFRYHYSYSPFSILCVFSLIVPASISFFKSVHGNDFGKSTKDRGLKIETGVVLYEEQDVRRKLARFATSSGEGLANVNEIKRRFHAVDLNRGLGSTLIVIRAVVIKKSSSVISYPYEHYCISRDKVSETLWTCSNMDSTSGTHRP